LRTLTYPLKILIILVKKLVTVSSWSAAFQNEHQNLGINTTSRIESINSKFKRFLKPNCRLLEQQYFIDTVNDTKKLKPQRHLFSKLPLKMKMLKDIYSNYVFKRIEHEYFSGAFEFKVNPTLRMNKWEVPNIPTILKN